MQPDVSPSYLYDVGISYLEDPDGPVAQKIAKRLERHGVSVFLARTRQEELNGTNIAQKCAAVFKSEARRVLVLHRRRWGTTPYTRIEQDAINDRRLRDSKDGFVKMILMDDAPAPTWYPDSRLCGHFDQLKVDGVVKVCLFPGPPEPAVRRRPVSRKWIITAAVLLLLLMPNPVPPPPEAPRATSDRVLDVTPTPPQERDPGIVKRRWFPSGGRTVRGADGFVAWTRFAIAPPPIAAAAAAPREPFIPSPPPEATPVAIVALDTARRFPLKFSGKDGQLSVSEHGVTFGEYGAKGTGGGFSVPCASISNASVATNNPFDLKLQIWVDSRVKYVMSERSAGTVDPARDAIISACLHKKGS